MNEQRSPAQRERIKILEAERQVLLAKRAKIDEELKALERQNADPKSAQIQRAPSARNISRSESGVTCEVWSGSLGSRLARSSPAVCRAEQIQWPG
jgi:hypothetical protein